MNRFRRTAAILRQAVAAHVTPAAVIEVGNTADTVWNAAFGRLTYDDDASAARADTIFDLASLTKVLSTTPLVMRAIDEERLALDDRIHDRLPLWRGSDREKVTVRDLLAHCSGLTAYLPFFRDHRGRQEFERAICSLPLEYTPRAKAVYTDLGFILLGFVVEDVFGRGLQALFDNLARSITTEPIGFNPPPMLRSRIAPTEIDAWRGRLLVGEVHDENCWALGGASGHAGLFGTAAAVGGFARAVLATLSADTSLGHRDTMRLFATLTADIPGSSRALGWDTMLPTSSCGTKLSPRSIGHTGFTGTSLWIDPERELYIALLTNRVHPSRDTNELADLRGRIHDAVVEDLART
jgi:CubicO group peptidase (beta-lactamase class C family)